jgi:hypothetical protein
MRTLLWRCTVLCTGIMIALSMSTGPVVAASQLDTVNPGPHQATWPFGYPALSHPWLAGHSCGDTRIRRAQPASPGSLLIMCIAPARGRPAAKVPSRCHPRRESTTRFEDCMFRHWHASLVRNGTGRVLGTVTGYTILWNTLSHLSRSWTEHIEIRVTGVTGEASTITFTAPISCLAPAVPVPVDCQPTGVGHWAGQTGFLAARRGRVYRGELGFESITSATVKFRFEVLMTFHHPTSPPASFPIQVNQSIRCDSAKLFGSTRGCVYPKISVTFAVSKRDTSVTQAAAFMESAQSEIATHPGKTGSGPPLTRLTDRRKIARNRRVACRRLRVPNGKSCDEYPFASTHQGAALAGPDGFKRKAINDRQNSKVGSLLGAFYFRNRVADGDTFFVSITD